MLHHQGPSPVHKKTGRVTLLSNAPYIPQHPTKTLQTNPKKHPYPHPARMLKSDRNKSMTNNRNRRSTTPPVPLPETILSHLVLIKQTNTTGAITTSEP